MIGYARSLRLSPRLLLLVGLVPRDKVRRYWWVIPVFLVVREIVGAFLMATVVPWLWSIVAALEASRQ